MKLAIFDMDGTLYNTNDVNYYAYKEALQKYNVDIDYDYYCKYCNGRHYKTFIPKLVNYDEAKVEAIHDLKKTYYSKNLDKVIINEHLFNIIKLIHGEYKTALVTTASKRNTLEILEYTNTKDYFDLILTAEDVKATKPNPEGFNKAIAMFNVLPENTIIFEDSEVGIEAARKTGASVMVVDKMVSMKDQI